MSPNIVTSKIDAGRLAREPTFTGLAPGMPSPCGVTQTRIHRQSASPLSRQGYNVMFKKGAWHGDIGYNFGF
jgi:hypothetical protein